MTVQLFVCFILSINLHRTVSQFPEFLHDNVQPAWMYKERSQAVEDDTANSHVAEEMARSLDWADLDLFQAETLQQNLSYECHRDVETYVAALLGNSTPSSWALKMADSTGKLESGIMDGNGVFEGRYMQCIDATADAEPSQRQIEPLYCLATWWTFVPGANIPLSRGLGMCIPDTCSNDDAEILLKTVYNPLLLDFREVSMNCVKQDALNAEAIITIIILSLFGFLVFLASLYHAYRIHINKCKEDSEQSQDADITPQQTTKTDLPSNQAVRYSNGAYYSSENAESNQNQNNNTCEVASSSIKKIPDIAIEMRQQETQQDDHVRRYVVTTSESKESKPGFLAGIAERVLLSFSLYENVPLLVTSSQPKGAIGCLNGMRFIAMGCVIYGHTYSSSPSALENVNSLWLSITRPIRYKLLTMDLYVDTFFIMSALLVTISFLKQLNRCNGNIGIAGMALHYFNRYWRLTPTYFLVLMAYTNLLHYFANGPFMPEYFADADSCSTEWWKNLLYVNTLFITEGKFCMGWSWYLAVDMQLFIIAPLFIYLLYRWKKIGIAAVMLGFCGGIIANIVLYEQYHTQTPETENKVDEFNDIYIKPWTRCPVYFMGILLGYVFYKTGGEIKMPRIVVIVGWIVAVALYFMCSYIQPWADCLWTSCDWTVAGKVAWDTLYRPMWGIWVCWLILACASGYGGVINTFLSWNFFVPLGRLTYLGYLIHLVLITVFYVGTPVQLYFTDFFFVYIFFANLLITNILSLIMAAAVSAPLMRLASIFIPSRGRKDIR